MIERTVTWQVAKRGFRRHDWLVWVNGVEVGSGSCPKRAEGLLAVQICVALLVAGFDRRVS